MFNEHQVILVSSQTLFNLLCSRYTCTHVHTQLQMWHNEEHSTQEGSDLTLTRSWDVLQQFVTDYELKNVSFFKRVEANKFFSCEPEKPLLGRFKKLPYGQREVSNVALNQIRSMRGKLSDLCYINMLFQTMVLMSTT